MSDAQTVTSVPPNRASAWALFNDGILIAFITFWGYLACYNYEAGYLKYFGIPPEFIEIEISNVLNTVVKILSIAIPLLLMVNMLSVLGIFQTDDIKDNPLKRQIHKYIVIFIFLVISLLFNFDQWSTYLVMAGLYVLWEIFWFTCVYNRGSFKERIEQEERQESSARNRLIINRIPLQLLLGFVALCLLPLVQTYGHKTANDQKLFLKLNDRQSLLVIRVYKDKLIAKPFISSGSILKDQIRIISPDDISSRKLLIGSESIRKIVVEYSKCEICTE